MEYGRCRILTDWPDWDYEIHSTQDQIDRQGWAMNYPFSFKIDYENKTARFSSTSALPYYDTSLTSCNCEDFEQRGLPCKHIYRLAVELGIINIIKRKPKNSDMYVLAEIYASDDIDRHPEQQKRIKSAKLAKTTPTSIDKENQTGIFPGSGKTPYETTLRSCTCRDFIVRHLPCKHIYRLKMELGLMPETPKVSTNKKEQSSIQLSLEEAVAEIEKLNNITQKIILGFLDTSVNRKETSFPLIIKKSNAKIQTCPLLEMSMPTDHSALRVYKRNDLIDILDEQDISGFKRNTSLDKLTEWCVENIPNIWNIFTDIEVFSFSDRFQKAQSQTYDYLYRKYKSIGYFPHSQNDLPDDEVTKLLKKYGHIKFSNSLNTSNT